MKVNRALTDLTTDSQLMLLTKLVAVCERNNDVVDPELQDMLERYCRCVTFNFATAKAKIAAKEAMDQEAFEAKKRRERLGEEEGDYIPDEEVEAENAARAAQAAADDEYSGGFDDGKYDGQGYPRATLSYSEPYPGLPSGQQPPEPPAATSGFSSFFPVMGSFFGATADPPVAPYDNGSNSKLPPEYPPNGYPLANAVNNNNNNNNGRPEYLHNGYPLANVNNNNNGRPDINGNVFPPNPNNNNGGGNRTQANTPTGSPNGSNQNLPLNSNPNSSSSGFNGAPTPSAYPNVNLYGNPKPNPK